MSLASPWVAGLVGLFCGVLSGFGIGGGSLLMVWLTAALQMEQATAQGINLLYFLPTAGAALPAHFKNGYVEKAALAPAILAGLAGTALAAWAATSLDTQILRRCFGVFLLVIGLRELLRREPPAPAPRQSPQ